MTPDNSLAIQESNDLAFTVLSDAGNRVAQKLTTVSKNDRAPIKAMQDLGDDFFAFYADESAELPVPASFVIGQDRTVLLASADGDYRRRLEAEDIHNVL